MLNKTLCRYLKLQPARIGCIQRTINRTEAKRLVGDLKRCRYRECLCVRVSCFSTTLSVEISKRLSLSLSCAGM